MHTVCIHTYIHMAFVCYFFFLWHHCHRETSLNVMKHVFLSIVVYVSWVRRVSRVLTFTLLIWGGYWASVSCWVVHSGGENKGFVCVEENQPAGFCNSFANIWTSQTEQHHLSRFVTHSPQRQPSVYSTLKQGWMTSCLCLCLNSLQICFVQHNTEERSHERHLKKFSSMHPWICELC